jgi:hypothetical protein
MPVIGIKYNFLLGGEAMLQLGNINVVTRIVVISNKSMY